MPASPPRAAAASIRPARSAGIIEHTGYGFTGGGTIGYNWQTNWNIMGGAVVVGLEGDIGYFDAGRRARTGTPPASPTITTRSGSAPPAAASVSRSARTSPTSPAATRRSTSTTASINTATGVTVSSSKVRSGYALGSGIETMLGGGWTAKSEYMFIDFGDNGDTLVNGACTLQTDRLRYHSQRFGLNYLFGAGNRGPLPQANWNGWYVGGVYGVGVSSTRGTGTDGGVGGELGNNGTGFFGGGQIGYNWMFGRAVVGLEGDISYLGIDHTSNNFADTETSNFRIETSWLATARAPSRLEHRPGDPLCHRRRRVDEHRAEPDLGRRHGVVGQDAERLDRRRRHRNRAGQQLVEQERVPVRRSRQRRRAHRPRHWP